MGLVLIHLDFVFVRPLIPISRVLLSPTLDGCRVAETISDMGPQY